MTRATGMESVGPDRPGSDLPRYDERAWPIFLAIMPKKSLSHDAMVAHLDYLDTLFERGRPFAMLFDARFQPTPTPIERKLIAERMARSSVKYPGRLRGMAIVLSSPIGRGVFTALQWLAKPPYPTAAVSSVSEGIDWLKRHASFAPAKEQEMR